MLLPVLAPFGAEALNRFSFSVANDGKAGTLDPTFPAMKTRRLFASVAATTFLFLGSSAVVLHWTGSAAAAETARAQTNATDRVVAAAKAFLATLDDAGRAKAVFAADDEVQRRNWSNLPSGIYKRAGLRLGDLSPSQLAAAKTVLQAALSPMGYRKTMEIVEGDEQLRQGGGGGPRFGRDEFYISFVGAPSATDRWTLQFGGHHLALNVTVIGRENLLAPSHTAAQPARYQVDGKTVQPLGKETALSFQLVNALSETQRKEALIGAQMRDLVLGPGQENRKLMPEGVKVSTFTDTQKALLLELAGEWAGIVNEEAATRKMAEIKEHLAETWFAWSGPTASPGLGYFRIQGPTVFIEYAPQKLGGDPTQHIHTMYRDPRGDYGATTPGN